MGEARFLPTVRKIASVATSLAVIGTSSVALAEDAMYARLSQVQGNVLVDSGSGFAPASENLALSLGDRVMVTDGGGAVLDFGENCSLPLEAPSMTTVSETACTVSTQNNNNAGVIVAGIIVIGGGTALALCIADVICDDKKVSP